ncbi:MAG: type II toxin-antitoxin system PemK/MazF family toxin [Nanoarchaeota archaeon]
MTDGINTEQRSIILIPFPYSDLSSKKKRPALIISNSQFNQKNEDVICCLITSNPKDHQHCIHISNKDMESGYLEFDSKIKSYRIFTASKEIIYKNLGKLNLTKSLEVEKEIGKLISMKS